ncbi:MAG: 1-deoxy-D-xylulose-5-phosphate reductoisomerase [Candidatus Omnitrophica bacterium]|nr:1-deoxy-D-xylulose-5-phosphate reductoisomerase [Candidatus Omnitrophota bacterium]
MSNQKRIIILGSTGSIGQNTLAVVRRFPDRFKVVGLSAHSRVGLLKKQAAEFKPEAVTLTGESISERAVLAKKGFGEGTKFLSGSNGLRRMIFWPEVDLVILAIPGTDSLMPAFWSVESGANLALASKEALVMAGNLLIDAAKKSGVQIIPLDSEHNAIFQIISAFPERPFWKKKKGKVSLRNVLAHPVWKMGPKVTVDSATMVNKALEIIEAHYLFGLPPEKIGVLIHPQVAVHGMVEFDDGFTMANLSAPDMRLSIASGLFWPERPPVNSIARSLCLEELGNLTFYRPNHRQFPALTLAYRVLKKGGGYPAIFSVANEEAVSAFLNGLIEFEKILPLVKRVLTKETLSARLTLAEVLKISEETRQLTRFLLGIPVNASGSFSQ